MEEIKKNLAALIKVKTIVTILVIFVFVVMSLTGKFQPDTVMSVVIMVVSFYFGTQTEKQTSTQAQKEQQTQENS